MRKPRPDPPAALRLRLLQAAAAVAAALFVSASAVHAETFDAFTLTTDKPKATKELPPLPDDDPLLFDNGQYTLENCKNGKAPADANSDDYMAALKVTMAMDKENGHETTIVLTWPGFDEGVDMDMYVFADNGTPEGELIGTSASTGENESVTLPDQPNGIFWTCIVNFDGVNQGYTLSGTVKQTGLPSFDYSTPTPRPRVTATPKPTPKPTPRRTEPPPSTPQITPEAIVTPGPDGPTGQMGLPLVAAGSQATRVDDDSGRFSLIFWMLTGAIVVTGGVIVALRIRRDHHA